MGAASFALTAKYLIIICRVTVLAIHFCFTQSWDGIPPQGEPPQDPMDCFVSPLAQEGPDRRDCKAPNTSHHQIPACCCRCIPRDDQSKARREAWSSPGCARGCFTVCTWWNLPADLFSELKARKQKAAGKKPAAPKKWMCLWVLLLNWQKTIYHLAVSPLSVTPSTAWSEARDGKLRRLIPVCCIVGLTPRRFSFASCNSQCSWWLQRNAGRNSPCIAIIIIKSCKTHTRNSRVHHSPVVRQCPLLLNL